MARKPPAKPAWWYCPCGRKNLPYKRACPGCGGAREAGSDRPLPPDEKAIAAFLAAPVRRGKPVLKRVPTPKDKSDASLSLLALLVGGAPLHLLLASRSETQAVRQDVHTLAITQGPVGKTHHLLSTLSEPDIDTALAVLTQHVPNRTIIPASGSCISPSGSVGCEGPLV